MKRSVVSLTMVFGLLLLVPVAHALKSQNLDPRDPDVWEDKRVPPVSQKPLSCEVSGSAACYGWEDEKSDIQRERERREQRRQQNEYERYLRDK